MQVPEETEQWFEKLADLLTEATLLSIQGEHKNAIKSFDILFECIDEMSSGEEIIFADEYGMWMLPIMEENYIEAYINSAATLLSAEDYATHLLPLLRRDSYESLHNRVYEKAKHAANKSQQAELAKLINHHNIKIK